MSGRKSSEVAAVLRGNEALRQETQNRIEQNIDNHTKIVLSTQDEINKLAAVINAGNLQFNEDARKEFPDSCGRQEGDYNYVLADINKIAAEGNGLEEISAALKKIADDLKKSDSEGAAIREAIRSKDWYCDDEYRRAKLLAAKYKEILRDQQNLLQKSASLVDQIAKRRNKARELAKIADNLRIEAANLNEVAKKRTQCNALRNDLQNLYAQIDQDWARKFFADEYAVLGNEVADCVKLPDDEFSSMFQARYDALAKFSSALNEKVADWQRQKADAEDALGNLKKQEDFALSDPVEKYNDGDGATKIALFDFLEKYAGSSQKAEYEKLVGDASAALGREDFQECMQLQARAERLLNEARSRGLGLEQSMGEKTSLAGTLQDIMDNLGYDTDLEIVDDNPDHGFRLTCKMGDEEIDFAPINIDDDGKVTININHKESISGTCGKSWKHISEALRANGVPVTDVRMQNGRSVLYQRAPGKAENAPGERARGN